VRAAIFQGAGKPLSIEKVEDPKPGPNEVVIKVHRCGICGTDLQMTSGRSWSYPVGYTPGHEYAGEIVEIGPGVEGYRTGDVITSIPLTGCGRCSACASGNSVLCAKMTPGMGGFGEYLRVPTSIAVRLPSTLSVADGALIEPLAVGFYGLRMAHIRPGDRVLVLGGGTVALLAIYWARRLGAGRIVAISRSARREALALEMGADKFVQSGEHETAEVIEVLGGSPDVVFECTGAAGTMSQAITHVGLYGHVVSVGFCTSPDPIIPALVAMKAARLSFPVGYALRDFEYAADMMGSGHVDPKIIISSTIALDELPATFEALRGPNNETKVHVLMQVS
jgi:2-desacetyl-2-hydroxyethyl bacteriochlorophyllide A dehydrogenase